ncbi:mannosyltransferase [Coemansia sp. RSA 990]|nr:mannosyltransferase [Coemansia sp. RSA 990]
MAMRQRHSVKQERAERREQKRQRKAHKQAEKEVREKDKVDKLESTHMEYVPSLSVLFRFLALIRVVGALLSPIQDCDEVYNYWEPLHFLQFGQGKQTWEYAPQFALRSYAYLQLHSMAIKLLHFVFGFRAKGQVFYALRVVLSLVSALCEAFLVRMVARHVDRRIANCTALALFGMAGLFHAAPALLPSSFAMCLGTLGVAATMMPPTRDLRRHMWQRVVPATVAFAVAVLVGWPYAGIMAVPFVLEEVLVPGPGNSGWWKWRLQRLAVLAGVGGVSALLIVSGLVAVDSWYYGRTIFAAWNQVAYNILGRHGGASTLYGAEPWYFYLKNGLLNGNIVMVLALLALPVWMAYYMALRITARSAKGSVAGLRAAERLIDSHWLLLFRIAPFYVVLGAFSLQPHKEERFLSIVYPHMCFCAAAALSLASPLKTWAREMLIWTRSQTGQTESNKLRSFAWANIVLLGVAACIGMLRMTALVKYYAAPVRAFMELPATSNTTQTNELLPLGPSVKMFISSSHKSLNERADERVVCMGEAWYWYPSSYWLPEGYRLQFVQQTNATQGQLPGDFIPVYKSGSVKASTSVERTDFNGLNEWEKSHVGELSTCDYLVDIEYPERSSNSKQVDRRKWKQVGECQAVLDTENSAILARILYVPHSIAQMMAWTGGRRQKWGQMCVFQQHKFESVQFE